jgi:hypothetical protein
MRMSPYLVDQVRYRHTSAVTNPLQSRAKDLALIGKDPDQLAIATGEIETPYWIFFGFGKLRQIIVKVHVRQHGVGSNTFTQFSSRWLVGTEGDKKIMPQLLTRRKRTLRSFPAVSSDTADWLTAGRDGVICSARRLPSCHPDHGNIFCRAPPLSRVLRHFLFPDGVRG